MLLCRTGPDHFDEYSLEASEGGFFDFSWGAVSSSISNACTTIANVTCDIGFGMCNGFFSPVDTTGEWIGGGGETPTASTAFETQRSLMIVELPRFGDTQNRQN